MYIYNTILVGGRPTPPKNISQMGWFFPIYMENKKCSKPPISYIYLLFTIDSVVDIRKILEITTSRLIQLSHGILQLPAGHLWDLGSQLLANAPECSPHGKPGNCVKPGLRKLLGCSESDLERIYRSSSMKSDEIWSQREFPSGFAISSYWKSMGDLQDPIYGGT